jgi:hypothetical protein
MISSFPVSMPARMERRKTNRRAISPIQSRVTNDFRNHFKSLGLTGLYPFEDIAS